MQHRYMAVAILATLLAGCVTAPTMDAVGKGGKKRPASKPAPAVYQGNMLGPTYQTGNQTKTELKQDNKVAIDLSDEGGMKSMTWGGSSGVNIVQANVIGAVYASYVDYVGVEQKNRLTVIVDDDNPTHDVSPTQVNAVGGGVLEEVPHFSLEQLNLFRVLVDGDYRGEGDYKLLKDLKNIKDVTFYNVEEYVYGADQEYLKVKQVIDVVIYYKDKDCYYFAKGPINYKYKAPVAPMNDRYRGRGQKY